MWQTGIPANMHNPKLLRPLFQAKKPWITLAALAVSALTVVLICVIPGWVNSLSYGNADNATLTILPSEKEIDPFAGGRTTGLSLPYPDLYDVENGMASVKKDFQTSFRRCTLKNLTYNKTLSDQHQEELGARYAELNHGSEEVFLLMGILTTGEKDVPEGLEPNTTYEDYQWVTGPGNGWGQILDHGPDLLPQ